MSRPDLSPTRPLVRASEIGLWAFCQRAWWLARVQQIPHQQPARLVHGLQHHAGHAQQVRWADRLASTGWLLLGSALLCMGIGLWWLLR
jgi:hypothetical protein